MLSLKKKRSGKMPQGVATNLLAVAREITEMSQRLEVARLLAGGQSYVYVQDVTGASATTISRVSKCLNYGSGGYERALSIIEHTAGDGEE
mgnify:CR=1 FL=1